MKNLKQFDFQLAEFSTTILTGDSHDHEFLNVHHGFLSARGVIPNEWHLEDSRINRTYSEVNYDHGIHLVGDKDAIHIYQTDGLELGEEPVPPKLAIKYLASITPGIFRVVRMGWKTLVPQKDPEDWITRTFFRPQVLSDQWGEVRTVPIIVFSLDDLEISFSFSYDQLPVDNLRNEDVVEISCRVESNLFSNDGEIIGWLSEWAEHENLVVSHVFSLMTLEDDNEV